jgi:hypothetical protein
MTVAVVILSLLTLAGIGFGYFYLYEYVRREYDFEPFGSGLLSIVPTALAGLGFAVVSGRQENYWEALFSGDLDVVLSLFLATVAFGWIFNLFLKKMNWWVALLAMVLIPPVIILGAAILIVGFAISVSEEQRRRDYRRYGDSRDDD